MKRLAPYNKLPARQEYIDKVEKVLTAHPKISGFSIQKKTNLTKTQALCTLDKLIADGRIIVTEEKDGLVFELSHLRE